MSTPWDVLGLDPETVDTHALRRAYVRLVKRHRPEREPKRFQAIREAYDLARRFVELAEETGIPLARFELVDHEGTKLIVSRDEAPADGDAPGVAQDEPPAEPAGPSAFVRDRLRAIQAALEGGDDAEAAQLLREAHARWRADLAAAEDFPELVEAVPDAYVRAVGDDAAEEDALAASTGGEGQVFNAVVRAWTRRGAWTRLRTLADGLLARAEEAAVVPPAFGLALGTCAVALALVDPPRAGRLAEEAHRQLPGPWRDGVLHEVDLRLAMVQEMEDVPEADRRELARFFAGSGEVPTAGPAFLALRRAFLETHPEGLTNAVLTERFPDVAERVDRSRGLERRALEVASGQRSRAGAWFWIVVVAVLGYAFHLVQDRRRSRDRLLPLTPPPRMAFDLPLSDPAAGPRTRLDDLEASGAWFPAARDQVLRDAVLDPAAADATLRGEGDVRRGSRRHRILLTRLRDDPAAPRAIRERCRVLLGVLSFGNR